MIVQLSKIKQDVRVCLDQNGVAESLITINDEETLMLDDIIKSKVLEGVDRVHGIAPYHLLEQGHNMNASITWEGTDTCGWFLLPDDFMRLVVFEMSDWERPVYNPISTNDPSYALQRGRVKGLRGTAQRPVCAIGFRPNGNALEFYSCKSQSATVKRSVYIPFAKFDSNNGVDISKRCYDAVVETIAGLTAITCGEAERASALFELAKQNLETK